LINTRKGERMEIKDVQLIQTDDLVDELFSRYDTAVFLAHKKNTTSKGSMAWNTKGNKFTLLGLSEYLGSLTRASVIREMRVNE